MKKVTTILALAAATIITGCNPLSDEAKQITGNYYINEISDDTPLMELRPDGTCTVRAIRPEILTYAVEGKWNVRNDSLVMVIDRESLTWEGDSSMIGDIPERLDKKLISHSDLAVELQTDGINYVYSRRK